MSPFSSKEFISTPSLINNSTICGKFSTTAPVRGEYPSPPQRLISALFLMSVSTIKLLFLYMAELRGVKPFFLAKLTSAPNPTSKEIKFVYDLCIAIDKAVLPFSS